MHASREPDPSIFVEPPEPPHASPDQATHQRNARYGLWLFAVYVVLYGGFIALTTFRHDLLARTPLAGVNLAILYGMALIVAALVLALIYTVLCRASAGTRGDAR